MREKNEWHNQAIWFCKKRKDMIDELRTLAQIAGCGSFSAAGRVLGLSPSSISRQMDKLEAQFGLQLLYRSTHHVTLTDAGQQLLQKAVPVFEQIDELNELARRQHAEPRGLLRISAFETFGRLHVAPLLPDFLRRYPQLQVCLELDNRKVDMLRENYDLCIRNGVPQDSSLRARRLMPLDFLLVASPDYLAQYGAPQKPQDLATHNCLVLDRRRQQTWWHFHRAGESQRVAVAGNLLAPGGEVLLQGVRAGLGLTILGRWMVQADLQAGTLQQVLPEWRADVYEESGGGIYLLYKDERYQRPALRALIDYLVEHLAV